MVSFGSLRARPWTAGHYRGCVPWSFWTNYLLTLATVTLVLTGLFVLARRLAQRRAFECADRRIVTVLESTMLSQHASLHVVRVGARYLLIGAANAAISTLGHIPKDDAEAVPRAQVKST